MDNRIFQLQISLAQTSDPQGRREVQKLLEQEEKKKRDYFQEKEEKAVSEFRRRKNETTKGRKVSSFDKLKDPNIIRWSDFIELPIISKFSALHPKLSSNLL